MNNSFNKLLRFNFDLIDHSLEIIDLKSKKISDSDIESLASSLKEYKNLKTLDLSSNNISNNGVKVLSLELKGSKLKTIILNDNKIGDSGLVALN